MMDTVPIDGTIVIGEGERDEAPMLYIGEKVGMAHALKGRGRGRLPQVDIAVDPLEGTNLCATGAPNAIAVLAASESGGLLHAPDLYMEKLVVGPSSKDLVEPRRAGAREPAGDRAGASAGDVEDLVVIVLDRPRHEKLIADIRATGARIRLIGDGDLSAGIAAAVVGIGRPRGDGHRRRAGRRADGRRDALPERRDLRAPRRHASPSTRSAAARWASPTSRGSTGRRISRPARTIIFAATGVTDGTLMRGVRFFGDGIRTSSLIMQNDPHQIRFIDSIHVAPAKDVKIRF